MPMDMLDEEETDPALDGEASKMAMQEIMALLQRAQSERLRSKMPKPEAPQVDPATESPPVDDQDVLAQLAEMLGAEDPDKAAL